MTDREALAAALDPAVRDYGWLKVLEAAAQERLAQMGEKCVEHGCDNGTWNIRGSIRNGEPCPVCHGKSFLYPPALVERIKAALDGIGISGLDPWSYREAVVVAVLNALNGVSDE